MLDKYTPIKREMPFPGQTTMDEELELKKLYLRGIILLDNLLCARHWSQMK